MLENLKSKIRESDLSFRQIARKSDVSVGWLRLIMADDIKNPGWRMVARVERVLDGWAELCGESRTEI